MGIRKNKTYVLLFTIDKMCNLFFLLSLPMQASRGRSRIQPHRNAVMKHPPPPPPPPVLPALLLLDPASDT